jgi:hypothetical protein
MAIFSIFFLLVYTHPYMAKGGVVGSQKAIILYNRTARKAYWKKVGCVTAPFHKCL